MFKIEVRWLVCRENGWRPGPWHDLSERRYDTQAEAEYVADLGAEDFPGIECRAVVAYGRFFKGVEPLPRLLRAVSLAVT